MREENFKDQLENENVDADRRAVIPALGGDKRRLEVAKIAKIIADEVDGNFDKMSTDEDIYNALDSLNASDRRTVFKTCAESLGVACDEERLARLTKSRVLALFFDVFDVYPAATPLSTGTVNPESRNEDASVIEEYFDEVFPNFGGAVKLDFAKVAELLPKEFRGVKSTEELKETLGEGKIPEGQIVRNFVEQAIKSSGIKCDLKALTALRRADYLPLFFHAIEFVNFAKSKASSLPNVNANVTKQSALPEETTTIQISFNQFKGIFDAANKIDATELGFDLIDTLKIFENNSVTVKDNFYLSIPDDQEILRGLVGIFTLDGEIAAIGHIEDKLVIERNNKKLLPHMVFDWSMIRGEKLIGNKTFLIALFPIAAKDFFSRPMSQSLAESYSGDVLTLEFHIIYSALAVTDRPLCIDFGTSNTTAGTYDLEDKGQPKLVTFRDVTKTENVDSEVLPTIVYTESCRDGIVNFKFGYEAKREIINSGYNTKATVFYEIKRWINSLDAFEEVVGTDGRETARIERRAILRDYLMYVIREAEQQYQVKFKYLHMTAPVKLRGKFLDEMKKIFKPLGYEVNENSLDEGVATVYHYIAEQIKTENAGKILILDCGGGTTDLASCNFSIEQGTDWPILHLQTDFENGDSNFGGNNITYKIFQMLKMKIAANLQRDENLPMKVLIPEEDDDILSLIDFDYGNKDKIYEKFEREYARAEDFIPTKFKEYSMKTERLKVKRNFYYLWQLAEAIKIEFFKSDRVNVDFDKNKKIFVATPEEYYLSVRREGKLQSESAPMENVEITIREINRIILPDLYALLKTLLIHYYKDNNYNALLNYKCRLSGQSCKINKFRDLIKEFVPGRQMRIPKNRDAQTQNRNLDSVVLKKYCILGSIEYVRDARALGKYKVIIDTNKAGNRRIYDVRISIGGDEKILLGNNSYLALKKFPTDTSDAEFLVRNENNRVERRFMYHFDRGDATAYTLAEVIENLAKETFHERQELEKTIGAALQNIDLPEYGGKKQAIFCLAALDSKSGYGFNIYQICVGVNEKTGGKKYWIPKTRHFESYEDEDLQTFFNGDK